MESHFSRNGPWFKLCTFGRTGPQIFRTYKFGPCGLFSYQNQLDPYISHKSTNQTHLAQYYPQPKTPTRSKSQTPPLSPSPVLSRVLITITQHLPATLHLLHLKSPPIASPNPTTYPLLTILYLTHPSSSIHLKYNLAPKPILQLGSISEQLDGGDSFARFKGALQTLISEDEAQEAILLPTTYFCINRIVL